MINHADIDLFRKARSSVVRVVLVANLFVLLLLIFFSVFILPLSQMERISLFVFFVILVGLNWALLSAKRG